MSTAISSQNLSKHYRLGAASRGKYGTLRESLMEVAAVPARRMRRLLGKSDATARGDESLWALDDVSFTIRRGESVGIIGRNGAGKSTLLKVLSRITTPTRGSVDIRGRVGSLLEVGTGFHPELTGRENIYLNGAIIGMSRREISRKFNQIVDFSEVGKFIDTPVKRYSSGMYVRLAFAVAAHMEPEILLIDEVLSVGDLAFQRKCMDFAQKLLSRNTTLLFVSHNMFAIHAMCDRAIYLANGKVSADGPTDEITRLYDKEARLDVVPWAQRRVGTDPTKCPVFIDGVELLDEDGQSRTLFDHGNRMRIRIRYQANEPLTNPNFTVAFLRSDDVACCNYNMAMDEFRMGGVSGTGTIELLTPPLKLVSELYSVQVIVWDSAFQRLLCAQNGGNFHVRHPLLSRDFGVFHEQGRWAQVS